MEPVPSIDHRPAIRRVAWIINRRIVLAKHLRAERFHVEGIKGVVRRVTLAGEKKRLPIWTPTKRNLRAGMKRQLAGRAPFSRNGKDVPIPIALAGEGNPFSVR